MDIDGQDICDPSGLITDNQLTRATAEDIISGAVTSTISQAVKTISLLDKSVELLEAASLNASFEQKLLAVQEARKIAETTSSAVNAAANLFLALGVKVHCDTAISLSSLAPNLLHTGKPQVSSGFEADESLPSASKYQLTFTVTVKQDISARQIVDLLLKGSGCQTVGRTTGNDWVTIRLENRQQLLHAMNILRNASHKGNPLISIGQLATVTKSAYAVRTFPFEKRNIQTWFNQDGQLDFEKAITGLNEENSGWFPNSDVESIEFYKASPPPGKDKKLDYIVFKVFLSQAAYRHFLRSSHDITNIEVNGFLVKVKEEVTVVQCWKCCGFGHYSNQCRANFKCRFCLLDHQQNFECDGKVTPQCRLCNENNRLYQEKLKTGDSSPGVTNFKDWVMQPIDHFATSYSCKTLQAVKAKHLIKLKHAAFKRLPLPAFTFP